MPAQAVAVPPSARPLDAAALFTAHHAAVYRTAYRITGQAEDAEDVLQTVFLQVLRVAATQELANPGGFLHRLAVNAALNAVRQRRRRRTVPLAPDEPGDRTDGLPAAVRAAALGADPGNDPGAPELRDRLRDALAALPPRAAEIFALRYLEGYTNRQIAELFETSESSIGVTLHRARQRLQAELAPLVAA
jgi:RNA polymerase sigma-70 factor (ECF subfamily)